ncbi:MAG: hypothetical protein K0S47_4303 [Herbinix sp.]|jgi:hypothetical protein|nr:hypothetical protein [Herbinix sp.]
MKKRRFGIIFIIAVIFLILWFSEILPKQVVKFIADNYITNQENSEDYTFNEVVYSPAQDCYFAYYTYKKDPKSLRYVGVRYRWFPMSVFYDSNSPG